MPAIGVEVVAELPHFIISNIIRTARDSTPTITKASNGMPPVPERLGPARFAVTSCVSRSHGNAGGYGSMASVRLVRAHKDREQHQGGADEDGPAIVTGASAKR